uniref:RdRp n=1 Tax=Wenling partiti-like virus 5 TaxID=1923523 RepID=A0A1L3KLR1_9VIRU|nr:RdRp [Wenling partiti-like virus 5]
MRKQDLGNLYPLFLKAKRQGWRRSRPSKSTFQEWQTKLAARQTVAKYVEWDIPRWKDATRLLSKDLQNLRCDTIALKTAINSFSTLGNSPGLDPVTLKREWSSKGDVPWSDVQTLYSQLKRGYLRGVAPFSVAFRSHLVRGDENKARIILVAPAAFTVVEKKWADPLFKALKATTYPKHWACGFDYFKGDGNQIVSMFGEEATSLDWSAFDLSPPTWMIRDIFDCMKSAFTMSGDEERVFDAVSAIHQRCLVKHGDSDPVVMRGGIKTGTAFTHILGTLLNVCMMYYIFGQSRQFLCYGDDTLVTPSDPAKVSRWVRKHSSFTLNSRKCRRREIHWLGLAFRNNDWVLIDRDKRMAQMFFPENGTNDPEGFYKNVQSHLVSCGNDPIGLDLIKYLEDQGYSKVLDTRSLGPYKSRYLDKCKAPDVVAMMTRLKICL